MAKFSELSQSRLATCDERLQRIFREVIKHYDCTVLCGHRDEHSQMEAYRSGHSKLRFPQSKHNSFPSRAVDVSPTPIDWKDTIRFYHFAGFVMATSIQLGIKLRHGGDWDSDFNFSEEKFKDIVHFELVD